MTRNSILLKKIKVHNLKDVDLELQRDELIVFTGVSGSGKSSLAFDTIYVEGQRRYIESLSTFARRYLGEMNKPDVEYVSGLSPTISIEQKSASKNPRSSVGTMTEVYDYLRVLYARIGIPHCPISGERVAPQSKERIIKVVGNLPQKTKIMILAPFATKKKGEFKEDIQGFLRKGYTRARIDSQFVDLTEEISLDRNLTHDIDIVVDRLSIEEENHSRLAEGLSSALTLGQGIVKIFNLQTEEETLFSTHAYSHKSGLSYPSLEPGDFSFNTPSGMCPHCHGLGTTQEFDLEKIIDSQKSIAEDCCLVASSYNTVRYGNIYNNLARLYDFNVKTPWKRLSERAKKVFLYGTEKKWTSMHFVHPSKDASWTDYVNWRGVLWEAKERYAEASSQLYRKKIESLMIRSVCPTCQGSRLKAYPAATLLQGKTIHAVTTMTIDEALHFFENLRLDEQEQVIAEELLKEIIRRLHFLKGVGLHYLSLDRTSPTLSGGESQRVRLASQVGAGLVGVTYVLDEPSIGLHPSDNERLINTLKKLRDVGNTVIVVEHDRDTIIAADRIVDFGPGPGVLGGEILVNGNLKQLLSCKRSLTGAYLSGKMEIVVPEKRRKPDQGFLKIMGAAHHNLKNIDVSLPLGMLIAVTGVSGSGKSSLITDILFPYLANTLHHAEHTPGKFHEILGVENIDKVIAIDQSPIGRNPRSNPATYIKVFDEIRGLFSKVPESVAKGYLPGRFSFNVRHGSCTECHGIGMLKIDMDFMEDAWIPCTHCKSKRFDHETLSIYYKGKNIYDVLEMSVGEALEFFHAIPSLRKKLEVLESVGMSYIKLGQPSTTLSGGEAQRIKLAKELARPSTGKTFYILDEPTTGLHFHDIKALLHVLQELVDRGNTVLVIEHNTDVIKAADWIIELGPVGGAGGGQLIASGTPESIAKKKTSTAIALKEALMPQKISTKEVGKKKKSKPISSIIVEGAEQNNLKGITLEIPRGKMTICTGPSGSGKSSFAFDTIYAEGQRRYIESLSPYARQFVNQMPKPKVLGIEGLSPSIAIEQKASSGNPRSTVGTMTEIYDYLRILFAHAATPYCPETGERIRSITKEYIVDRILELAHEQKIVILSPLHLEKNEKFEDLVGRYRRLGYLRLRLNGILYEFDEEIPFDRKRKNEIALVIDRLKVKREEESRLHEAIEKGVEIGNKKVIIMRDSGEDLFFNLAFAVEKTGKSYPPITPHTFSFNHPEGMCMECLGLGIQYGANLSKNETFMSLNLLEISHFIWNVPIVEMLHLFLKEENIHPKTPLYQLPSSQLHLILKGHSSDRWLKIKGGGSFQWIGLENALSRIAKVSNSEVRLELLPFLDEMICPTCRGGRINPLGLHARLEGHSIASYCSMPIQKAYAFLEDLQLEKKEKKLLEEVLKQIKNRLKFLIEVGLHYLSLDRRSPTLSNGEAQRIRLARQLGASLTGVLYVLDEPTIGLHPHDNAKLGAALKQLKDLGNTLLMVEHDPLTIAEADHVIDFGPGAGFYGGYVVASGTVEELKKDQHSPTGAFLSGKKEIPLPKKRRTGKGTFLVEHAKINNLKDLTLEIPKSAFTCLTGVSGSGKSTLMHAVIRPLAQTGIKKGDPFDKLIVIDQNPIGHTVRSDVGTYVEVLTPLRDFFSQLALSRMKGLQPKHFSYNHRKGMCTHCFGLGYKKVEMLFLAPVRVTCDVCRGLRLNPVSLEVKYQGANFGEILGMTVEEARLFFEVLPKARRIFDTLISTGLGYLKLGQEMATLSGGEAQRMKLSRELAKRGTGKTLYLMDEPTTGQHPLDIEKLLQLFHLLVDKGNTLIVIEHNLDVIKNADMVFDIGPAAGVEGGFLVAQGTPEEIAKNAHSYTGKYLKQILSEIGGDEK